MTEARRKRVGVLVLWALLALDVAITVIGLAGMTRAAFDGAWLSLAVFAAMLASGIRFLLREFVRLQQHRPQDVDA